MYSDMKLILILLFGGYDMHVGTITICIGFYDDVNMALEAIRSQAHQ